eukprot:102188-Pyramimonas_sp.AAC.1
MHLLGRLALENPARSRSRLLPRLQGASKWSSSASVVTDICQWGTQWKKPTRFLGDHVSPDPIAR